MKNVINYTKKIQVRTVWISDVHLGYKDCKAEYLHDFLDSVQPEYLYLVGDIIDLWAMKENLYWPEAHNRLLRKILKMAKDGVQVIYVPGNHDHSFREYCGDQFGSVEVHRQAVHYTLMGKKFLIMHGDEFDDVVRFSKIIQILGDQAYDLLLFANRCTYYLRRWLGLDYWSLAAHVKQRIGRAAKAIDLFERSAIAHARNEGCDGIVCGHIHHPNAREESGIFYFNDGDWVENCSTLVERKDGAMELWHWSERSHCMKRVGGDWIDSDEQQLDLLRAG